MGHAIASGESKNMKSSAFEAVDGRRALNPMSGGYLEALLAENARRSLSLRRQFC